MDVDDSSVWRYSQVKRPTRRAHLFEKAETSEVQTIKAKKTIKKNNEQVSLALEFNSGDFLYGKFIFSASR